MLLAELRKEEVNLSPLNMKNIVQEALERLQPLHDKKEATIEVPNSWPEALGYGPWVEEVWVNYISNALKYGGDPPNIELGAERDNNNSVAFWVRDNGKGLTKEEQSQLFVPFTHLKKVDTEGYGLGLSIVHRIIDKLDGEVWVRSTPKQGSTFGFTLQKVKYGSDY
jgi:signal transduction histidine kinase